MILMNDFKSEPLKLHEAMISAAKRVIESGWYVLGNEVVNFEKQWADTCGVNYAVGVGNGMDAIEIALRSMNIGEGDEVITTPMTAFATVLAIFRAGATPVLADIDPETALLSIKSVSRCITPRTKAVLLVHLYGQVRKMQEWLDLCNNHNLHLIEDCAQAHLATWKDKVAGSFGVAGAYSFYPTKNLGAIGDAGMLVTKSEELARRAGMLRNYGQSVRYYHPEMGLNSRLDEIHAAILVERSRWLREFTERRRQIADAYRAGINNPLIKLLEIPEETSAHVYHLFVIVCEQRNQLQEYLKEKQIQTHIHYPVPVHFQEPCNNIARDPQGLDNSERHADTCLSIPCHPQMTDEEISVVIHAINAFQGI